MNLNQIRMILTISVLSAGLISCSQDKKTVYKSDTFNPNRITAQNSDKSEFKSTDLSVLDVGGTFTLESLRGADFTKTPVMIKIQSRCRQGEVAGTTFQEFLFQNTAVVKVLTILPEDLLSSVSSQPATCDFTFIFTNSVTSTHTEIFKDINIKNFDQFANLQLDFLKNGTTTYSQSHDAAVITDGAGTVRLSCEDVNLILENKAPAFSLSQFTLENPKTQSQLTHATQKCRVLFIGKNGPSISPVFNLNFPSLAPEIQALPQTVGFSVSNPLVVTLSIYNPNAYPLQMKMTKVSASSFIFKPFYFGGVQTFIGTAHTLTMKWVPDVKGAVINGDDITFTVLPQKETLIEGFAQASINCITDMPFNSLGTQNFFMNTNGFNFLGYNFNYSLGSQIHKVVDATTEENIEIKVAAQAKKSLSELPYWQLPGEEIVEGTKKVAGHLVINSPDGLVVLLSQQHADYCSIH